MAIHRRVRAECLRVYARPGGVTSTRPILTLGSGGPANARGQSNLT